jgi:hypothetical protein
MFDASLNKEVNVAKGVQQELRLDELLELLFEEQFIVIGDQERQVKPLEVTQDFLEFGVLFNLMLPGILLNHRNEKQVCDVNAWI